MNYMKKPKNKYYAGEIEFNTLDERDKYYKTKGVFKKRNATKTSAKIY